MSLSLILIHGPDIRKMDFVGLPFLLLVGPQYNIFVALLLLCTAAGVRSAPLIVFFF